MFQGTRMLDSRTMIVDATQQFPVMADRPDPTPEERERARQADRIVLADLLKAYRWTVGDLEAAIGQYSFPKSIGRLIKPGSVDHGGLQPIWSRAAIAKWEAAFKQFAASMPAPLTE